MRSSQPSDDIVISCAEDKNDDVRKEVVKHPNTTANILIKLAEDKDWIVSDNAENQLRKRGQ